MRLRRLRFREVKASVPGHTAGSAEPAGSCSQSPPGSWDPSSHPPRGAVPWIKWVNAERALPGTEHSKPQTFAFITIFSFSPPSVSACLMFSNDVIIWCGIYLSGRIYFNSFINDFSHEFIESLKGRRGGSNVSFIFLHFMAISR